MKIRSRKLEQFAAWAGSRGLRAWLGTTRYRQETVGPVVDPNRADCSGRFIYIFWHEYLLLPSVKFGQPHIHVLISQHRDGQMITDIITRFGFSVVRGSSERKGAVEATRKMIALAAKDHLAITPDGPRGPRRVVQQGVAYLASKTGLPVVPMGVGLRSAFRAKSWDRFALAKPFSRTRLIFGEPLAVPAGLDSAGLETQRLRIQAALDLTTGVAEKWAESGVYEWPSSDERVADAA